MDPTNTTYLSNTAIFYFHDYGRKSKSYKPVTPNFQTAGPSEPDVVVNFPCSKGRSVELQRGKGVFSFKEGNKARVMDGFWKFLFATKQKFHPNFFF